VRSVCLAAALALTLGLGACAPDSAPAPPAAAPSGPETLLQQLRPDALADAFARLDSLGYTALVRVEALDPEGVPTGSTSHRVDLAPDGRLRVTPGASTGTLGDTTGLDLARLRVRDPLPGALPEEPTYLDPTAREFYRFADGPAPGRSAVAIADTTAGRRLPVRRAALTLDAPGGAPLHVAVERRAASTVYQEATTVDVRLAPHPGGPVPARVQTETRLSTLLGTPRHLRLTWTVQSVGGTPIAR
jgi:hypothetical protein